jgi:hypothetical protein
VGGRFRLIGLPEKSWEWPHIELPDPMGYGSIEALPLTAQRAEVCVHCALFCELVPEGEGENRGGRVRSAHPVLPLTLWPAGSTLPAPRIHSTA